MLGTEPSAQLERPDRSGARDLLKLGVQLIPFATNLLADVLSRLLLGAGPVEGGLYALARLSLRFDACGQCLHRLQLVAQLRVL